MSRTKSYDELTFADDFMFCKILVNNPDLCEELVSLVVGKDVRIVHIEKQAPIEETSDGRGVRLDVYVEGDDATIYDIEMQTTDKGDLPLRARYYQSMIDLATVDKAMRFTALRDSFVIFLCTFDAFGKGRHVYSFRERSDQDGTPLGDGTAKLFLCPGGGTDDVSPRLRALLDYVGGTMTEDPFVERLDRAVVQARMQSEWRKSYMDLAMKYQEKFDEGHEQGLEQGLKEGRERGLEQGLKEGRERGLEQGLKEGREKGLEQGLEQGLERGLEQGIRGAVSILRSVGLSDEDIRKKVSVQFDLSEEVVSDILQGSQIDGPIVALDKEQ